MRRSVVVAIVAILLAGCGDEEKPDRGIELMPDMFHTPAFKSQGAGEIQVEGRDAKGDPVQRTVQYPAMMTPPEGTVPRGFQPYPLAAGDFAAARLHRNPLAPTPAVLKQGQRDFLTYCAPCHGRDGNSANGYVAKSFSGIPSLNGLNALQLSDGEVFHILTMGRARMPNMRAQLPPERRWAVVHFLKVQARSVLADQDLASSLPYLDEMIAKNPGDAELPKRRAELVRLAVQAKADLAAIKAADDGSEFIPPPAPVPEWVGPTWPQLEPSK